MTPFARIRAAAARRHGGEAALAALLPEPQTAEALRARPDRTYLSQISFRVFSAGLKQSMVEAKWPAFEEVFAQFEPRQVRAFSDEALERLMAEPRIIRHWGKIKATRANAAAMCLLAEEHGSFGAWLADWPAADIVGLWAEIARRFTQMGGLSAPYVLRRAGKDTFVPTGDVNAALAAHAGVTAPSGRKGLAAAQAAINAWAAESGLPLCQISRILALSVDSPAE